MALSKLDQLYREVILDHSAHPKNKGLVPMDKGSGPVIELKNPTCGDVIQLQLQVNEAGIIEGSHFDGVGCSISMASASMLTELLQGKSLEEAHGLSQEFSKLVQGETVTDGRLGDASLLAGVAKFPARIKCATLAWKALDQLVDQASTASNQRKEESNE